MENGVINGDKSQPDSLRWQVAGHEVIYDRNTFRHKAYRKDFAPGTLVKVDGVPVITAGGKVLCTDDIFPERGDLCLDMDANIVPQHEFERRYKAFLEWFTWIESTDLLVEPVPDVAQYVSMTYDTFSESRGFVPIGFDARKKAEGDATHRYDPIEDKMVEIAETQKVMAEVLKAMTEKRGPGRPPKVREEE